VFFELVARSASVDASNFRVLRVLRILRLVRILRVVRVLHLISELRAIVSSIVGSFRSLVWVVVLLLLLLYIVAVFFTQSITDHLTEAKNNKESLNEKESSLGFYFGSLGRALLSLWQAISGGLDWDDICGPLFADISAFTGLMFAAFIAFALLALMNVVTGVFVQTALLSAQKEEDSFMQTQIIQLFKIADKDESATISIDEIENSLQDPATSKEWKSIGVQAEDARHLFKLLDVDGAGQVAFEEFMGGTLRLHGGAKAIDVLTVMQEQRKNEEKIFLKFGGITEAIIDVHETVKHSQEDMGNVILDVASLHDSLSSFRRDMDKLSYFVGFEFASVKQILTPLDLLEQALTLDTTANVNTLV